MSWAGRSAGSRKVIETVAPGPESAAASSATDSTAALALGLRIGRSVLGFSAGAVGVESSPPVTKVSSSRLNAAGCNASPIVLRVRPE
jgi:hypothetical protein